jgi:hypothetical protein
VLACERLCVVDSLVLPTVFVDRFDEFEHVGGTEEFAPRFAFADCIRALREPCATAS